MDKFFYMTLEAVKIGVVLLFGLIFNGLMILKAGAQDPVSWFILSIVVLALAWIFWWMTDALAFAMNKPQLNMLMMVVGFGILGYLLMIIGLISYFKVGFWWITIASIGAGAFGFWRCDIMVRELAEELARRNSNAGN